MSQWTTTWVLLRVRALAHLQGIHIQLHVHAYHRIHAYISHTQIHSTETITEKLAKRNVPFIYIYIHTVKDFLLYSQSVNLEMPSQSQCGPFEMVIM